MTAQHSAANESVREPAQPPLQKIKEALRGLQYGSVTIIVQDGIVVQIERTEKQRLRTGGRALGPKDTRQGP